MSKSVRLGVVTVVALLAVAVSALAIIGGADAPKKRYPWVTQVRFNHHLCTGSLVGAEWVVTAAHCVTNEETLQPVAGARLIARIGSDELDSGGETRSASRAIPHPAYDDSGGAQIFDLALIQLDRSVPQAPVPLVQRRRVGGLRPGSQAFIAGWGTSKTIGFLRPHPQPTRELKDALVRLESDPFCREEVTEKPFNPTNQICSIASSGEACHGDSGGPLFLDLGYPRSQLLGVITGGERHCKPGYPGLYVRLTDGPMRTWLAAQLAAAARPMTACADLVVRGHYATTTVRHIRANVACAVARSTAANVTRRDDCVEETSGGLNECGVNSFVCATRLKNGPAGVELSSTCDDGTRSIRFRQGSAEFVKRPPQSGASNYSLTFSADGRPTGIGPFNIDAGDRSIKDMMREFGRPDSLSGDSTVCTVRWDALGLKAYAVDFGTADACDPDHGLVNATVITSPLFVTDRGLAVGMSLDELLSRHPRATTRGLGDSVAFDSQSPPRHGELYSIHYVHSPIGRSGVYATLKALVKGHTVVGLEVVPLLGGD